MTDKLDETYLRLFLRLADMAKIYVPPPDWTGPRRDCACGHSWRFHWLQDPHGCNDCKECKGFR